MPDGWCRSAKGISSAELAAAGQTASMTINAREMALPALTFVTSAHARFMASRERSNFKSTLDLVVLRLHDFQERARNPAPLRLPVVRTLAPLGHRICGKCQEDRLLLLLRILIDGQPAPADHRIKRS